MKSKFSLGTPEEGELDCGVPCSSISPQFKKRRICATKPWLVPSDVEASLPILCSADYFMKPSLKELIALELNDPGHCSRVQDFTVGRLDYGYVKFLGQTDVRWLDLDQIVKFYRHEIVVYENEMDKPVVGQGLNKAAEVSLILKVIPQGLQGNILNNIVKKLQSIMERQGARFISFDPLSGEWKFLVCHFSRFGLTADDEDDIVMDDATTSQHPEQLNDHEGTEIEEEPHLDPADLSHSLPAHLGLDPIKIQEMRMLMFPVEENVEELDGPFSQEKQSLSKECIRPALQYSARKMSHRASPPTVRRTPQALLEYNPNATDSGPPGTILMTWQNKGMPLRKSKAEGFKLDLKYKTPVTGSHSGNIVDAALFMGRSFRVGWGPNGVLVHTGMPVGKTDPGRGLSSTISVEKVAMDKVVRDENNKVKKELIDFSFSSPLSLHKSIDHETTEVEVGSFKLKLRKLVSNRVLLPEICRSYIEIVEKQNDVPGLSSSARAVLMHQVMVWELIKVLFATRKIIGHSKTVDADNEEDMMHDKNVSPEIDLEALPFMQRAEFSCWLQESVCHRVQEEISCLNESSDLQHMFLFLSGRQLDAAVELAAIRGDVRLSCLLSQAGGSMVHRYDVAQQLDLWRVNGLDFNFIEKDRFRLYELLAGNIESALNGSVLDWKRYLGLLMWYQLPPSDLLPVVVQTYQTLLDKGRAPYPVPVYIDEGPLEEAANWSVGDRFDLAYYLMLLHADEKEFKALKTMFSAFSSTYDALDYHMIWHQRAILEAVGAFSSNDLHVLDMSLVSQLLSLGQCHWAIYIVLHMPYHEDFPYLQAKAIWEILFQYCESWSAQETQRNFIVELGVPSAWLHEAMGVYFHYYGDLPKALEHFLECCNWQKAHSIFLTPVAHSLFLSGKHSEIWSLATSMEDHKSEIADWDLGAGIYISFYLLKASFHEEDTMGEADSLERKNVELRDFFSRLNESLAVFGNKLPVDARATYSKMAEELCSLLLSNEEESFSREVQLSSFDIINSAPLPEDLRSCHLQEAVSLFTFFLSEKTS